MSDKLFDFISKHFAVFFLIALFISIGVSVYIFQQNPRCLLTDDPFLCLEVTRLSE